MFMLQSHLQCVLPRQYQVLQLDDIPHDVLLFVGIEGAFKVTCIYTVGGEDTVLVAGNISHLVEGFSRWKLDG